MAKFKYKTKVRGKVQKGAIEADNEKAANVLLKQKNIKYAEITAKKS